MKKHISRNIILFIIFISLSCPGFTDEIILKSGEKVKGTIVERGGSYLKIKTAEEEVTFFNDEISQTSTDSLNPLETADNSLQKIPYYHITSFSNVGAEKDKSPKTARSPIDLKKKKPKKIETIEDWTFNTAIITYSVTGYKMGLQIGIGQVIVYIDKKQNKIASVYTYTLSILDKDIVIKTKDIYDGKTVYMANLSSLQGLKLSVAGDILSEFFHHKLFENRQTGSGKILGRDCKVFFNDKSAAYFWNGIMMKETPVDASKVEFAIAKEAIGIKINPVLPADTFKLPDNIKYSIVTDASGLGTENIIMLQDYLSTEEGKNLQQPKTEMNTRPINKSGKILANKFKSPEKIETDTPPQEEIKEDVTTPPAPLTGAEATYSSIGNLFMLSIPLSWTWNEQEGDIAITNPGKTSTILINHDQKILTSKPEAQAIFTAMNQKILKELESSSANPTSEKKDIDFNGIPAQTQDFNSSKGRISLINFYTNEQIFTVLLSASDEKGEEKLKEIMTTFRLKAQP